MLKAYLLWNIISPQTSFSLLDNKCKISVIIHWRILPCTFSNLYLTEMSFRAQWVQLIIIESVTFGRNFILTVWESIPFIIPDQTIYFTLSPAAELSIHQPKLWHLGKVAKLQGFLFWNYITPPSPLPVFIEIFNPYSMWDTCSLYITTYLS